jgi:hypothetical protein
LNNLWENINNRTGKNDLSATGRLAPAYAQENRGGNRLHQNGQGWLLHLFTGHTTTTAYIK